MRTLTNNYQEVEVWNLDAWSGGRGPFLVVQTGAAPGADSLREGVYVLRPDGLWVDTAYYVAAGRPELIDEVVFGSTQQVMELLDSLDPEAKIAPLDVDDSALQSALTQTTGQEPLQRMRAWLEGYRQRHRDRKGS
jgi:hypothetical protein